MHGVIDLGQALLTEAQQERRTAHRLRNFAVVLVLAVVVVASVALLGPARSQDPFPELIRLAVTLPLAVLAAWLGREAGHHRDRANRLHGVGLQLHCFGDISAASETAEGAGLLNGLLHRALPDVATEVAAEGPSMLAELGSAVASLSEVMKALANR